MRVGENPSEEIIIANPGRFSNKIGRNNTVAALASNIYLVNMCLEDYWFLNFLLNPAKPTRPVPRRSKVAGSGTVA
jgi:hypothetical protein